MIIQFTFKNMDCNEVGIRSKIEVINRKPIIKPTESFMHSEVLEKFKEGLFNLIYNALEVIQTTANDATQRRKPKNLTAATEVYELKNTTSDSETFLGRFKQQNNEVSQQINPISYAYHDGRRQHNGPRRQEVSRYRL